MSIDTIPWPHSQCIVCLEHKPLTVEHVIPDAIGGVLTCRFLCKSCNDSFGSRVDANAKTDPAIRSAAQAIRQAVPMLAARIEQGQQVVIGTKPAQLLGVMRNGKVQGRWTKLDDGSLIAPEEQSVPALRGMLKSEGLSATEIDEAIQSYTDAEFDKQVRLSNSIAVIKRESEFKGPKISGAPAVSDLLLVKVAYEFTALLIGGAIYRDIPTFRELRRVLTSGDTTVFRVERLFGEHNAAFHGIAFEGNDPYAKFQVRLFGKPAFRIHLIGLALDIDPIAYTHDLVTGEHWHNAVNSEVA